MFQGGGVCGCYRAGNAADASGSVRAGKPHGKAGVAGMANPDNVSEKTTGIVGRSYPLDTQ
jgi:hypothetical protein